MDFAQIIRVVREGDFGEQENKENLKQTRQNLRCSFSFCEKVQPCVRKTPRFHMCYTIC